MMAITSYTGTLNHGSDVTLNGSGFGSKTRPGPLIFDDFAAGTVGNQVEGNTPLVRAGVFASYVWADNGASPGITYGNTSPRMNSTKYAQARAGSGGYLSNVLVLDDDTIFNAAGDKLFISCYHRPRVDSGYPSQWKYWIAYRTDDQDMAYFSTGTGGDPPHRIHLWSPSSDKNFTIRYDDVVGEWFRSEHYLMQSTPSANDGIWNGRIFRNAPATPIREDRNQNDQVFRTTSAAWNWWGFGVAYWPDSGNPGYNDIAFLYVDETPQRVLLGNASTWTSVTRAELQRAHTRWDDTGITINVDHGYFASSATAWLYVFDADDNPLFSGNGFEVTLSEGGGGSLNVDPETGFALSLMQRMGSRSRISKW